MLILLITLNLKMTVGRSKRRSFLTLIFIVKSVSKHLLNNNNNNNNNNNLIELFGKKIWKNSSLQNFNKTYIEKAKANRKKQFHYGSDRNQ